MARAIQGPPRATQVVQGLPKGALTLTPGLGFQSVRRDFLGAKPPNDEERCLIKHGEAPCLSRCGLPLKALVRSRGYSP